MIINPSATPDVAFGGGGGDSNVKWTKINDVTTSQSIQPRPRHGHRAVAYGNFMVVFGGGNEGIVEELHVFDTTNHEWFQPQMKGEIPQGCAAYGLVLDGCRMLLYGGMTEYGRYSSDLYELNIPKWEWKRLKPKGPRSGEPPCARLGHSFTIIRDQVYLFGGLANDSDDLKNNIPRYLNDMYILQARLNNENGIWEIPVTFGSPPGPRESHTAVAYTTKDSRQNKLIVYGGMSGCRLGDLYLLDIDTLMWCKPEVGGATPSPRSLHTSTLVAEKMYVFGGWVPMLVEELKNSEKEWKCTNSLACLNVETLTWENLHHDILDDKVPRARAGHSAVVVNTRIYIWSGRDGYRKAWNNQVCCKDLWQLEVQKPGDPGKVQLLRAGTNWLEVGWNSVPGADSYILQCVAYDVPSDPIFQGEQTPAQPLESLAAAGYAPSTPIMTPVPTSKPAKSIVPPPVVAATPPPPQQQPPPPPIQVPSAPNLVPPGIPVTLSVSSAQLQMPQPVTLTPSGLSGQPALSSVGVLQPSAAPVETPAAPTSTFSVLSMPSLGGAGLSSDSAPSPLTVVSATSISPAVLPTASSLYTLPANVAGTASSLLASKTAPRPIVSLATNVSPAAGRGVLRLRTPVQVTQSRVPGIITTTTMPTGATVLKSTSTGGILATAASVEAASAQLSGMQALAAAAAATQKIQTPPQTMKVVQQSAPGQPQVFSQVKMANVSGVLPATVRLASPVSSPGKPVAGAVNAATAAGNVKQIIVQKPGTPGAGNQIYTVVKTSQGMALANIQGSKVIQGKPGGTVTTTNVLPASSIQGSPQKTANIIKWVAAPGSGVTTVSKPNIIASNQPILSLAGQGASGTSPRPTYIISKPATTTIAGRPQAPQYVVVTQASAIRSIQGMTTTSLAGSQTITLPTSAAAAVSGGGPPQGVKMIVMPSGSGAPTAGQTMKIITPGQMQAAASAVPKTVTLAAPKPTAQYITSGGQIVTLPPGLLQSGGQQQISIGGKQVTLQMAGGQKLAILSNSGGQLIQGTSQNPGDAGKTKFVMVGAGGQKTTLPTSTPLRFTTVGGVLQSEMVTATNAAAEGLVEMAAGGIDQGADHQQNLNGMSGEDQQGGLKGGSTCFGPWSTFGFEGASWMKLKGGGRSGLFPRRNGPVPIYSVSSQFSWRDMINGGGLRGGAASDDGPAGSAEQSQQAAGTDPPALETVPTTASESTSTISADGESVAIGPTLTFELNSSQPQTMPLGEFSTTTAAAAMGSVTLPIFVTSSGDVILQPPEGLMTSPALQLTGGVGGGDPITSLESDGIATSASATAVEPVLVASSEASLPEADATATYTPMEPVQVPLSSDAQTSLPIASAEVAKIMANLAEIRAAAASSAGDAGTFPEPSETATGAPVVATPATPQLPTPEILTTMDQLPQGQPITTIHMSLPPPGSATPSATISLDPSQPPVVASGDLPGMNSPQQQLPLAQTARTPSIIMQSTHEGGHGGIKPPTTGSLIIPGMTVCLEPPQSIPPPPPVVTTTAATLPPPPAIVSVQPPPLPIVRMQTSDMIKLEHASLGVPMTMASNGAPLPGSGGMASVPPPAPVSMQFRLPGQLPGPPVPVSLPPAPEVEKVDQWMDVIHTKSMTCAVKCYFTTNEKLSRLEPDIPVDKDLEFIKKKVELKPATAYKFRVAAINSCGRGPWGEVAAFKTCLPGFPGAPSSIKITKSIDGATIGWEPPLNTPGDILEYSVYLAVRPPSHAPEPKPGVMNLSFVRVYCGPANHCNVPNNSLSQALVDTTSKPAIIFRIAAKNDKGYGPATQVRWLQESAVPNFAQKGGLLKRSAPTPFTTSTGPKRGRAD